MQPHESPNCTPFRVLRSARPKATFFGKSDVLAYLRFAADAVLLVRVIANQMIDIPDLVVSERQVFSLQRRSHHLVLIATALTSPRDVPTSLTTLPRMSLRRRRQDCAHGSRFQPSLSRKVFDVQPLANPA